MTDPNKRLMISAVALVTGNSVVDDLWLKYFPELEDDTEIARDIIITAHLHAVMGRMLPMTDFVRYIEKETKWAESTIKACIGRLRKSNLLRREIGEDSRIYFLLPTKKTKATLIEMGSDYAVKMHSPISSLLEKESDARVELVDDIQALLNSAIHDY